ncbi:MAG TPA: DUF2269 family protein [Candidatus Limnocylindrales bacterium]|nr:DUF2269 family protein [Candidatus Limnocylindrales bacterium]
MEPANLVKLLHVGIAFGFISGLIGRWVLLRLAAQASDPESAHTLANAAAPFEKLVIRGGPAILLAGLATAWAQGYPWLGLTTGWMVLSVILLLSPLPLVPLVFLPRGRVFEAALADARRQGLMTPELRAAFADPAVAFARRFEIAVVAIVVVLMVTKPF